MPGTDPVDPSKLTLLPPAPAAERIFRAPVWEYKVVDLGTEVVQWRTRLDNLGRRGWELVVVLDGAAPTSGRIGGGTHVPLTDPRAILKRLSGQLAELDPVDSPTVKKLLDQQLR